MAITKGKIKQTWQETPTSLKIGVGVLSLYIFSKALSSLKSTLKGEGFGKDYSGDIKKLEKDKNIKPSYSDQVYVGFADTIYYEYLNEFYSDIEDVLPIFEKLNNDVDYIKLTQAFGERRLLFTALKGSLGVIIRRMFNTKDVASINAVLKKKNINAQF